MSYICSLSRCIGTKDLSKFNGFIVWNWSRSVQKDVDLCVSVLNLFIHWGWNEVKKIRWEFIWIVIELKGRYLTHNGINKLNGRFLFLHKKEIGIKTSKNGLRLSVRIRHVIGIFFVISHLFHGTYKRKLRRQSSICTAIHSNYSIEHTVFLLRDVIIFNRKLEFDTDLIACSLEIVWMNGWMDRPLFAIK